MIADSISAGAAARQPVEIVIIGRSILGVICTGRRAKLKNAQSISRMQHTATATGLLSPRRIKGKGGSPRHVACLLPQPGSAQNRARPGLPTARSWRLYWLANRWQRGRTRERYTCRLAG